MGRFRERPSLDQRSLRCEATFYLIDFYFCRIGVYECHPNVATWKREFRKLASI